MKFAIQSLAALGVLAFAAASVFAQQATPPRAAPPARMLTLPSRTTQPGVTPYRPLTTANLAPITSQASHLQQPQQRAFNLDSAVARVLAEMKIVGMVGEIEMAVTNAGKVEITVFPLLVHVFDGQVRTEMDISAASALITATGPLSALRQVGLTKVINLTQLKGSAGVASQIFPEGNCYVTRDLPVDDLESEGGSGHPVVDRLVRGNAALADGVEVPRCAGGGGGDLVYDAELRAAGGEQLIPRIMVRIHLARWGLGSGCGCGQGAHCQHRNERRPGEA